MSRAPGRPRDAVKRMAVLDAACRLFLAQGYEATRMDDVAAAAGVSKTTVYVNYATKELLYEATVAHALKRHLDPLAAFVPDAADSRAAVVQFAEQTAAVLFHPDFLGLHRLTVEMARQHPAVSRSAYTTGYKRLVGIAATALARLMHPDKGFVHEADAAAERFLSLFFGSAYFGALLAPQGIGDAMPEIVARDAVEFFLRGLRPVA